MSSTPLLQDWLGDDAAKRHRREIHFPTGRFGEAIEQAQAVLFLATDESSFVNGQDFVVDGGMTKVSSFFFFPLSLFPLPSILPFCPTNVSHPPHHHKAMTQPLIIYSAIVQAYVTPEGPATEAPKNLSTSYQW